MATIQDLPTEILIKIFREFNSWSTLDDNLLNLTKVCKRFNDIISNEKTLVSKLVVLFTRENVNCEWVGSRKYEMLNIEDCSNRQYYKLIEVLKNFGHDIKHISFYALIQTMRPKIAAKFLNLCPNVNWISSFPSLVDEVYDGKIPRLNLHYLGMTPSRSGFKLLRKTQTKSVTFELKDTTEGVREFLSRQKSLTCLTLTCSSFHPHHEVSNVTNCIEIDFTFPLKRFELLGEFFISSYVKFFQFILNHKTTLEEIHLQLRAPLKALCMFSYCELLKKIYFDQKEYWGLDFSEAKLQPFFIVTELELTFYEDIDFKLGEIFPNLRKLKLHNPKRFFVKSIGNLLHLKELLLSEVTIDHIPKAVKILTFDRINFYEMPNFHQNCKVEEISFHMCTNLSWIGDFLGMNKTRLKKIMLSDLDLGYAEAFDLLEQAEDFQNVQCENVKLVEIPKHLKEQMRTIFK